MYRTADHRNVLQLECDAWGYSFSKAVSYRTSEVVIYLTCKHDFDFAAPRNFGGAT